MHYAAQLYALLLFQLFLWAIRRWWLSPGIIWEICIWLITEVSQLFPSSQNPFTGMGNAAAQLWCKFWYHWSIIDWCYRQNNSFWPRAVSADTLWEEEDADLCQEKVWNIFFFSFRVIFRRCKHKHQAEGGEGPGLGEQNDGKFCSEQQGAGPVFQTLPVQTAQRFIRHQWEIQVPPRLFLGVSHQVWSIW